MLARSPLLVVGEVALLCKVRLAGEAAMALVGRRHERQVARRLDVAIVVALRLEGVMARLAARRNWLLILNTPKPQNPM